MVWEMFLFSIFMLLVLQDSAFFNSLILIPYTLTVAMFSYSNMFLSSFFSYVFIMIFVGGLLVLLVSVTSTSVQEQLEPLPGSFSLALVIFSVVFSLVTVFSSPLYNTKLVVVSWSMQSSSFAFLILILLLVELVVISWNMLVFKNMMRSMCFCSVVARVPFENQVWNSDDNLFI